MVVREQLEIIGPDGTVAFYEIDPAKGLVNIGRHKDNDIVIESSKVALFHAILDYSTESYTIVILDEEGETYLDGQPLPPNVSQLLPHWSPLEIDGYTLMLVEGHRAGTSTGEPEKVIVPAVDSVPAPPAPAPSAQTLPSEVVSPPAEKPPVSAMSVGAPQLRPVDMVDDYIIAELSQREWTIDVEQTASFTVKLTNGGPIVATLELDVEGVDASWVDITPRQIELVPRQNYEVRVSITPPRHSSSRAGVHYPTVVVTSPEHPRRVSQTSTVLTINPYYDFIVGELSPKEQSLSSRDVFGETLIHIANKGNCPASFRIEATDDARGCTYEFVQETNGVKALVPQAELLLPPEETFAVPMRITPKSRPFLIRRKRHSFTVTAALVEGSLLPRALLGQLSVRPRIGVGVVLLALFVSLLATVLLFRPRIDRFAVVGPTGEEDTLASINAGQQVTLVWEASFITNLDIAAYPEGSEEDTFLIEDSSGSKVIQPREPRVYTLKGETWLFRLLPFLSYIFPAERQVRVDVWEDMPEISAFCLLDESDTWNELSTDELIAQLNMLSEEQRRQKCPQAKSVFVGDSVIIVWGTRVGKVEPEVSLTVNGNPKNLPAGEYQGRLVDRPESAIVYNYTLRAKNFYNPEGIADTLVVTVNEPPTPTPTPLPEPQVVTFDVNPSSITDGEEITLQWSVENATKVSITGLDQPWYPPVGSAVHMPTKSTDYRLVPITVVESGAGEQSDHNWEQLAMVRHVDVSPKPEAPTINRFVSDPPNVDRDIPQDVVLSWTVGGDVTDISISSPSLGSVGSGLPATGELRLDGITASSMAGIFFLLEACNVDQCKTASLTITVEEPPPEVTLFRINSCNPPECTRREEDDTPEYDVVFNEQIELAWETRYATEVTLFFEADNLGNQYPDDILREVADEQGIYRLQAANASGETVNAYLRVYLVPPVGLPGPTNFNGPVPPTDPLTFTWNYDGEYVEYISGFRIRRYRIGHSDDVEVRATIEIDDVVITPSGAYQWVDEDDPPSCGWIYYAVAYYDYPGADLGETNPSSEYSLGPCPTP
jgi:pSer/pThr/pTyr-binding forkhead associated (FHA) protein